MQNFIDFYNTDCCRVTKPKSCMFTLELRENYNGKLFSDHFNEVALFSHEYHKGAIGEVKLNNVSLGVIKIEALRSFHFSRLTDIVSYLNIGKDMQFQAAHLNLIHNGGKTLPPDTMLTHMVCSYLQRNIENQTRLITEYWNSKQIKTEA